MRPKGSADVLEDRRRRAVALLKRRGSLHEVARALGCAASSVMRWRNAFRRGGPNALKVRPTPGRPPKLTARQQERLVTVLLKGALAHGYRTELWTTARIAEVIEKTFGVPYHRDHVGRLMHKLGWNHQKPEARALQRDEERIAQWKRRVWPRVKKTPRGWGPTSSSSTNPASS
jgi:transposase